MNIVHAIQLKGVGPFKDVTFKIKPGVSVIYGLNRAGGRASKNSNGVGKSLLWSSPSDIIYDEPIVGERQDRIRTGNRGFSFTNPKGHKIIIRKQAKGKSEKLSISVDGQDKQFRTSTIAKQYLKKVWPITQEEYNTYVHIDSRVPHPLVMGTSAQRKSFFTSFFNLHRFDIERKLYVAELNKLQRTKTAFGELRAQYNKQKTDLLTEEQYKASKSKERFYKQQLRRLQKEFEESQAIMQVLQFAASAKDQIKALNVACASEITQESFEEAEKQNRYELKKIEQDLEETEAWERYKRDNSNYTEAYNSLSVEAKKLIKELGIKEVRIKTAEASNLYARAKAQVLSLSSEVEDLETEAETKLPTKVEAPTEDIGDLQTLKRAYSHQIDHAEKFSEGKCETCGQVVQIKDPRVLKKKLDMVVSKLRLHQQAEEYKVALAKKKKAVFKLRAYKRDLERTEAKARQCSEQALLADEIRQLPRKPKAFEGRKLQIEVLKKMNIEIQDRRSLLEYMKPHLDTVIEFLGLNVQDIRKAKSSNLSQRMNTLSEKLSKVQTKLGVHETVNQQLAELRLRLVEMKKELRDEEPLRHLVKGYQDKNLKRMVIESISQDLMNKVNTYSKRVFPESFSYEFKWDTQIQLLVHRKYGRRTLTSDVRKLSGAESTFFTLVLVCALLAYVPSSKRCSVLILDEPSARLHPEMTDVFKDLIQVLNTLVPSIIIITPKSDEYYEGATPYTIVKRGGVATVVPGFPHQIK